MMRHLMLAACLALMAGCAKDPREPIGLSTDEPFGDAVRANMAAHIIDPTPPDPKSGTGLGNADPGDGQRRVLMIERYRADQVETPATTAISEVGPSSSTTSE
jgi:type IV pilus biogenesis protein CpaD/CtpE